MKLTDQIKEKIERADSKEKKQDILNDVKNKVMDAGVILDDSKVNKSVINYIESLNKPMLGYQEPDNFRQAYLDFYDSLL